MEALTCARHPDTETYLRCSSCETAICPACWRDAAVGYHCPDCAAARDTAVSSTAGQRSLGQGAGGARAPHGRLPVTLAFRAVGVGLAAALAAGMLLGPVLAQGFFFLITAGALGWGVARAVYWATNEVSSPFVRAVALTMAGFMVAVGLVTAGLPSTPPGIMFLAYPVAVYGGWIVVRQR